MGWGEGNKHAKLPVLAPRTKYELNQQYDHGKFCDYTVKYTCSIIHSIIAGYTVRYTMCIITDYTGDIWQNTLRELAYLIIEYTVIILHIYHKYNLKDSYQLYCEYTEDIIPDISLV
jgi:hypothetical protein